MDREHVFAIALSKIGLDINGNLNGNGLIHDTKLIKEKLEKREKQDVEFNLRFNALEEDVQEIKKHLKNIDEKLQGNISTKKINEAMKGVVFFAAFLGALSAIFIGEISLRILYCLY